MIDFELIDSVLKGNQKDFERLIKKYETPVFHIALGLLHSREDAEEVTQDVFLKVYRNISAFNRKAAFSTWLYRLTVNTSLNVLRRKKRQYFWTTLSVLFQVASKEISAETKMTRQSDADLVGQAIDRLPQNQRLAFVLTKYEELPQKQVAAIMKISEGAVEQLVVRAKQNLRKKLQYAVGCKGAAVSKK